MKRVQLLAACCALLAAVTGCKKEQSLPAEQNLRQTERVGLLDEAEDGRVYTRIGDSLYCHSANTGDQLWVSRCPEGNVVKFNATSPEVNWNQKIVYVGSGNGILYAYDALTGAAKWTYPTNGPIYASPLLYENVLYVASTDGKVHILNATTGSLYWAFDPGCGAIYTSPIVYKRTLYVVGENGLLKGININSGAVVLSYYNQQYMYSSSNLGGGGITADNDILFIQCASNVNAVSINSQSLIWSKPIETSLDERTAGNCPTIANGILYVTIGEVTFGFNANNGNLVMRSSKAAEYGSVSPLFYNNRIYVPNNGWLNSFNATDGSLIATTKGIFIIGAGKNAFCLASTNQKLLFIAGRGARGITQLLALDPLLFRVIWKHEFKDPRTSTKCSNVAVLTSIGVYHSGDSGAQW